jgi:hypothetical protein
MSNTPNHATASSELDYDAILAAVHVEADHALMRHLLQRPSSPESIEAARAADEAIGNWRLQRLLEI